MPTPKEINYLLNDVIFHSLNIVDKNFDFKIKDEKIILQINNKKYIENNFHFNVGSLEQRDMHWLEKIYHFVTNHSETKNTDTLEALTSFNEIPFLKLILYFTNEKYFLNSQTDFHDRFIFSSVDPKITKFLEIPIADILIRLFIRNFSLDIPEIFTLNFTCDFDILNLWNVLGTWNSAKRMIKSFYKLEFKKLLIEVPSFLLGRLFVRFNPWLNDKMFFYEPCRQAIAVNNIAFLLVHFENKNFDCNNRITVSVKNFLDTLAKKNISLGLHLSYNTIENPAGISIQKEKFEKITNTTPFLSRFHYLRARFPAHLSMLDENKLQKDYSFAFHDTLHFRGGITKPFKMWNGIQEKPHAVEIIPMTIMDATLSNYLKCDYLTAKTRCLEKIESAARFGFQITLLWHNNGMYQYDIQDNYQPALFQFLKNNIAQRYCDNNKN